MKVRCTVVAVTEYEAKAEDYDCEEKDFTIDKVEVIDGADVFETLSDAEIEMRFEEI